MRITNMFLFFILTFVLELIFIDKNIERSQQFRKLLNIISIFIKLVKLERILAIKNILKNI